jgi:hypothetical protein
VASILQYLQDNYWEFLQVQFGKSIFVPRNSKLDLDTHVCLGKATHTNKQR